MRNDEWTIKETYDLPSMGKLYPGNVNPKITLRSMDTTDEMVRLNNSGSNYKAMCDLIDGCIVDSNPGISVYDMCIGDYVFLLHRLRAVTYGADYKMECRCPFCRIPSHEVINLDDIPVNQYSDDILKYIEIDLPVSKKHIKLNYQTPRMVDSIESQISDIRKKSASKVNRGLVITLQNLIKEVDGHTPDVIELEELCQHLPMRDTNYILKCAEKLNSAIGPDLSIEVECEVCGSTYRTMFRQTGEFFGPEIDL